MLENENKTTISVRCPNEYKKPSQDCEQSMFLLLYKFF